MYEVRYFNQQTRRLLPGRPDRFEVLPKQPVMDIRRLAEAQSLTDPNDVQHWNGMAWRRGPLPNKSMNVLTP